MFGCEPAFSLSSSKLDARHFCTLYVPYLTAQKYVQSNMWYSNIFPGEYSQCIELSKDSIINGNPSPRRKRTFFKILQHERNVRKGWVPNLFPFLVENPTDLTFTIYDSHRYIFVQNMDILLFARDPIAIYVTQFRPSCVRVRLN